MRFSQEDIEIKVNFITVLLNLIVTHVTINEEEVKVWNDFEQYMRDDENDPNFKARGCDPEE